MKFIVKWIYRIKIAPIFLHDEISQVFFRMSRTKINDTRLWPEWQHFFQKQPPLARLVPFFNCEQADSSLRP